MNRVSQPCHFCCGFGVDDETMKEEHETYHVAPPILSDADKAVLKILQRDLGKYSLNYVSVASIGRRVTKDVNWTPEKVLRVIREEDPGIAEFKRLQKKSQEVEEAHRKIFYVKDGKQCIDTNAAKEYLRLNAEYLSLMK